ncbi:LysR family transcriptional regulator [Romboutsia weinsteinii]|uniref:LysR family transcriptional regulator n=1 Tax=Romboutsia weinsteinii TaxID=2020949 RepID=A0A371J7M0_9FIRM|nr:LysR family transcriptional regulator [Romboutsia weinsteinii]RDY28703.1 LysR family transcriptional regulator [Romboutsia weinsteinii]
MELLHLRYFLTVAKTEHITKASKELRISQPSLSKIISSLEKELEIELFDRKGKSIELNSNGRFFYDKVSETLNMLDSSIVELKDKQFNFNKEIKILALAASTIITEILIKFRELYPDIKFDLTQSVSDHTINTANYDLIIYSSGTTSVVGNSIDLLEEDILLAIPFNHILASKNSVNLSEVSSQKFICLGQGGLKNITDSLCEESGFIPSIVFESNNPSTVRDLIAFGQGVSFIPGKTWRFHTHKRIKLLKINSPNCRRTVRLYHKESKNTSNHILLFKKFLIDYFQNL